MLGYYFPDSRNREPAHYAVCGFSVCCMARYTLCMKEQFPSAIPEQPRDTNNANESNGNANKGSALKNTLKKALVGVSAFVVSHPALARETKTAGSQDPLMQENTRSYQAPDTTIGGKDSVALYRKIEHAETSFPDSAEVVRMYNEHKAEYDARYGETISIMNQWIPNLPEGYHISTKRFTPDGPVQVKVKSEKDNSRVVFPDLESFRTAYPEYHPYVADAMKHQTYAYMKDKVFEKIVDAAKLETDKESVDLYVPSQEEIDIMAHSIDGNDELEAYYRKQMTTPEQEVAFYKKYKHQPNTLVVHMRKKYFHPKDK